MERSSGKQREVAVRIFPGAIEDPAGNCTRNSVASQSATGRPFCTIGTSNFYASGRTLAIAIIGDCGGVAGQTTAIVAWRSLIDLKQKTRTPREPQRTGLVYVFVTFLVSDANC